MTNNNIYSIQIGKRIYLDLFTKIGSLFLFCFFLSIFSYFTVHEMEVLYLIIPSIIFFILSILLSIQVGWDYIYLKSYKYECRKNSIYFGGGVISRFEKNIPYSKIQHVILYETFLQRIMGISSVSVETARESGAGVLIPDLLKKDAVKLKDYIISISSKYKSIAGV